MKTMVRKYAENLLEKTGCNLDCYKGFDLKVIEGDLLEYYKTANKDVKFSIEEVAKALREIGDEQPDPPRKGHKKYCMVWDTDSCMDGIEFDSFEAAKNEAIEVLILWQSEEMCNWKCDKDGNPILTEEQKEDWDYMIYNYGVYVVEWDEEKGDWESIDDGWTPSDSDLREIGWVLSEEF